MNDTIKKEIMARVHAVHAARKLSQPVYIEFAVLLALAIVGTSFVSVGDVLVNLWNVGLGSMYSFMTAAFMNTNLVVQAIVCTALVVCALFIRDIIRYRNLLFLNSHV